MPVILDGAQCLRPLVTYSVQFGATATTPAQAIRSRLVRLNTTAAVVVELEGGTVSTATSMRLSADQTEYFQIVVTGSLPGVKAADSSAAGVTGTLYFTECG